MRLMTFRSGAAVRWGKEEGGRVRPLDHLYPSLKHAIAAGALRSGELAAADAEAINCTDVEFMPVIPDPGKIICVGLNYEDHRRETGRAVAGHPTIFVRFARSQTAHLAPIKAPLESDKLDYEGELAVVIGSGGRRIKADAALASVAGYACYNDATVRDWQAHTIQFTPGKNFPDTGSFGPWLVTPDEFGAPDKQRLQTRLNGAVMQDAVLGDLIFPVAQLIEYCSTFTPLEAGDVIVTGTPGGVGAKRNPPLFMKPGDTIEVEIEGAGILRNVIAQEACN
jgi:2-keto-4-pentenoate hydratase/2-oxohepta-3-ene-1,7-dioic acid hydratase in catechol pathway